MPALSPLPEGCILRPAFSHDRWKIHRLLQSFEQELDSPIARSRVLVLRYVTVGLLLAITLHSLSISGIGAVLSLWGMITLLWVSIHLALLWSEDWSKFWVIEFEGRLIACAKLCTYNKHAALFNVLVAKNWRGMGVGSHLVGYLVHLAPKPLYLACNPDKIAFYAQFGFAPVPPKQLGAGIRYDLGLATRSDIVPLVLREP